MNAKELTARVEEQAQQIAALQQSLEKARTVFSELRSEIQSLKKGQTTAARKPQTTAARKPQRNTKGFMTLSGNPAQRKAQLEAMKAQH